MIIIHLSDLADSDQRIVKVINLELDFILLCSVCFNSPLIGGGWEGIITDRVNILLITVYYRL